MSLWKQMDKKENKYPDHHITFMRVEDRAYIKIRQPGYPTSTYDLGSLGDAIENCPEDAKRYFVLHKAYSILLKNLEWNH